MASMITIKSNHHTHPDPLCPTAATSELDVPVVVALIPNVVEPTDDAETITGATPMTICI